MKSETWFTAEQALAAGFADEINAELVLAKKVAALALQYKHTPSEVRAMAGARPTFDPHVARRKAQRRRLSIIAEQALAAGLAEDAARGARTRSRYEMLAVADRAREEAAREEEEERAKARLRREADYAFDHARIPREFRRYV